MSDPSNLDKLLDVMAERRIQLFQQVGVELTHAYTKHGTEPWGRHEFYAILLEEVDELWDAIKSDKPSSRVLDELIQVIAVCFRYVETGGDRYTQ